MEDYFVVRVISNADEICKPEPTEKRYVAVIDADTAKRLLDQSNPAYQRKRQENDVRRYVKDMHENRWVNNHQSLLMDKEGNVINGQHRLSAVISSRTVQEFDLVKGVDRNIMFSLDDGRNRTKSDIVSMSAPGIKYTQVAASSIEFVCRLFSGTIQATSNSYKFTNAKLQEWIDANPVGFELIQKYSVEVWRASGIIPPKIYAGMRYIFECADPEKAELFFDQLVNGVGLEGDSPVLYIRNYFINANLPHAPLYTYKRAFLMIKAWNDFVTTGRMTTKTYRFREDAAMSIVGLTSTPYNVPKNWIQ